MITDSRLWNLYLAVDTSHIDVMAYCPIDDHPLLTASIPLDTAVTSRVEAIEEAVYDNPLLLNDFKRITVVSRSHDFCLIPTPVAAVTNMASDIVTEMTGVSDSSHKLIADNLPLLDISLCHMIDNGIYNFLSRTFNGVKFIHHLSALTRYGHGTHRSTGTLNSHVFINDKLIDIILLKGDRLLLVNSYHWQEPTDMLYYIMAARRANGIDNQSPVVVSADHATRDHLMPLLRQYIPTVMPAIFPAAMFRAGGSEALNAPTDLVLLPLCE